MKLTDFFIRPQTIVSKLGNIEITPIEEKKRQLRAMRFQDTPSKPPPMLMKLKKKYTPIVWDTDAEENRNRVIVGSSTALEKPYFRLTSVSLLIYECM